MPNSSAWSKPGPYVTKLPPDREQDFQQWVQDNHIPWQDTPDADYDMRGFYQSGEHQSLNGNDGKMHFPDTWKTPYHQSFSRESIYATDGAPSWNEKDQLVLPNGTVIFDERNNSRQQLQRGAP
jgi:hypothetical protein